MTLRYGLIGCGMMGQEHIRNIALLDGARIVALADPDAGMIDAARHLAGTSCAVHADHRSMLYSGNLDAVIIAAPNHLHHPILADVIPSGLPILCEKPLCTTRVDCASVRDLAHAHDTPVWVAMEYRYMAPIRRLIDIVHGGDAGRIRMLTIREHRYPFLSKVGDWNRFNAHTGGTLVEKCCHFFDLMRLILASEPVRVYASGAMDENHVGERYDGRQPDIIDNAYVIVDFASGSRAMLDLCMFAEGSYWQEVISATGPRARVDAMVPGPARFWQDGSQERSAQVVIHDRATQSETVEEAHEDHNILGAGDHHGSTYHQHVGFLQMVRDRGTPDVTLDDGLRAVAVGEAAEISLRTQQPVDLEF
ncbi:MAG: Gfo/Idh/MocA family oxidoreductase [Pseudomonadota bacterium]